MITRETITNDLAAIGVSKGDVLFVRADLSKIGLINSGKRMDYLSAILDALGDEGTLVAPAFTKSFFLRVPKDYIFDGTNKTSSGAIANLMLEHKQTKRSTHPTNSFMAIGKQSSYILEGHDENSGTYDPIRKIIKLNGKMIVIGCVHSNPGITTTHLAEIDLGLDRNFFWPSLNKVYYKKNGDVLLFKRKDLGSCSSTYYRFYSHYVYEEALTQGYIGNAYSIMMDAKKAYEIDYNVLKDNPRTTICNNLNCTRCHLRRKDNLRGIPLYLFHMLVSKWFQQKNSTL